MFKRILTIGCNTAMQPIQQCCIMLVKVVLAAAVNAEKKKLAATACQPTHGQYISRRRTNGHCWDEELGDWISERVSHIIIQQCNMCCHPWHSVKGV